DAQDKQVVDVLDLRKVALIVNYANTCFRQTNNYFEPQNLEELKAIIQYYHDNKLKIRLVGSRLSPNVIGLSNEGGKKRKTLLENKKIFKFFEPCEKKIQNDLYYFFFLLSLFQNKKKRMINLHKIDRCYNRCEESASEVQSGCMSVWNNIGEHSIDSWA
ncbi:hypothetical protein RFI_28145, partial [Reticulomyxa filosa]